MSLAEANDFRNGSWLCDLTHAPQQNSIRYSITS